MSRCDDVQRLKDHKVAITADCMLYQNHAVRKIDERVYRTPYIGAHAFEVQLKNKQAELKKAENDPSIIEIQMQIQECQWQVNKIQREHDQTKESIGIFKNKVEGISAQMNEVQLLIFNLEKLFKLLCDEDLELAELGTNKFNEQIKTKTPATIVQNFSPLKVGLDNKKNEPGDFKGIPGILKKTYRK